MQTAEKGLTKPQEIANEWRKLVFLHATSKMKLFRLHLAPAMPALPREIRWDIWLG